MDEVPVSPEERGSRHLRRLASSVRSQLYRLLSEPASVRADAIGQLYRRPGTRGLAEVLIDVEADAVLRLEILRSLRVSLS